MNAKILLVGILFLLVLSQCKNQQNQSGQQIQNNQPAIVLNSDTLVDVHQIVSYPGNYQNESVRIEGHVTQYIESTATTTAFYYLKGNFGDGIKVITSSEKPNVLNKYEVWGTVIIDAASAEAFLVEKSKRCLDCPVIPPVDKTWCQDNQTLCYIIFGGSALLLILIIVYLILRTVNQRNQSVNDHPYVSTPGISPGAPSSNQNTYADTDFKTIKISHSAPKTLKLIPGKLQITSGLDKGKEFRMNAFPTATGGILTIGREKKSGDAEFSHIQLLEKTVSRQQAELIYKDNKLYVKNLSETNYTQMNGTEIRPGEMVEVQPDSVIKTGEVEFRYIV